MSLPNPGMDFTPFDVLPASELDDMVENIEALAAGTGLNVSAVTPEKIFTGTGTTWALASYTPTFANTTLGSGTVSGSYKQIGKYIYFIASFTLGAGSAMGTAPTVTLPVTSVTMDTADWVGNVIVNDSAVSLYKGMATWATTTTAAIKIDTTIGGAGTYVRLDPVSATAPMAWNTGDKLRIVGLYPAA